MSTIGDNKDAGTLPSSDPSGDTPPAIQVPEGFAYATEDGAGLDFERWSADAQELATLREASEARAKAVPDAYETVIPEAIASLDDGHELKLVADAPEWGAFQEAMKAAGASQEVYGEVANVFFTYAARQFAEQQAAENSAFDEQVALLAPEGTAEADKATAGAAEFDRIKNALDTVIGDDVTGKAEGGMAYWLKVVDKLITMAGGPAASAGAGGKSSPPTDQNKQPFYRQDGWYS